VQKQTNDLMAGRGDGFQDFRRAPEKTVRELSLGAPAALDFP
jgi:hypothetical protein